MSVPVISRESLRRIKPLYATWSAWKYALLQVRLAAAAVRDWRDRNDPASPPVPPARLRHRVHGRLDKESYLEVGRIIADDIRRLCTLEGHDIYAFRRILDFGCGAGRVISRFQDVPASCRLFGTDIDAELVRWCRRNLPRIGWMRNGHRPPLPFADDTFDLIYAVSVFTHLDEEYQRAWLRELQRVATVGALVILTVHGEHCISEIAAAHQREVHAGGFLFVARATGRLKLDGLPDYYQSAYHTQDYVRREWSAYFDVVGYVERGIHDHQDAVLLRKR